MTHVVESTHVETLTGGRMVAPGDVISDAEAKKNPKLVERGTLAPQTAATDNEPEAPAQPDGAAAESEEPSTTDNEPEATEAEKPAKKRTHHRKAASKNQEEAHSA